MKNRSIGLFSLLMVFVLLFSYVAIAGVSLGNLKIPSYGDSLQLGLDLKGGIYVVLEAQTDLKGQELKQKMEEAKLIIEKRVNGIGVSEPNIAIEGEDRIRVELAGLSDPQQAVELIGKTALLEFKDPDGNVILTGENVKEANAIIYENRPAVSLKFDGEGTEIFKNATQKLVDKLKQDSMADTRISIVLDGNVVSDPTVSEVITGGESVISGSFSQEKAITVATSIKAGALPVELKELEISVIGPTLGIEAFEKSIIAGAIGIGLIFIFMIIIYRLPGALASIALSIYVLLVLGIMISIGAKLTLPGIAGLILSIGMAVDANVVIFERIKEELSLGKTTRVAVKAGFKRALTSIIDANVTTLIAGIVLFYFGTGLIKGFAVTLIIGLVVSVFTAVIITRILLNLAIGMGIAKSEKSFGVQREVTKSIDFIKYSKFFMGLSGIIVLVGVVLIIVLGFRQSIDFTGGTLIQIDFGEKMQVSDIRQITNEIDTNASIVHAGNEQNQIIIKTTVSMENEERIELFNKFKEKYPNAELINQAKNEPSIGNETKSKAVISVVVATVLMLVYITIRFEFKFGVAAIVALLHDILIGISVYAIFRIPISSSFIAAMLTILGYSINDTIVVFDRIRENVSNMRKEEFKNIVNISIMQSIKRAINTSLTTLIAIVVIYILGVESIKEFALPLIIGVVAGTCSSIFIASPIWYMLIKKKGDVNYYNPNKVK